MQAAFLVPCLLDLVYWGGRLTGRELSFTATSRPMAIWTIGVHGAGEAAGAPDHPRPQSHRSVNRITLMQYGG
jgi:hypothetical protein